MEPEQYDAIVIGSGFGGSVAALRLAEKGHRVVVLEQGRRVTPDDMRAAEGSLTKLMWAPALGAQGFFTQRVLRHVGIVGGVGVGGGSLVYAAVLLEPTQQFFGDPVWRELGLDLAAELGPHYRTAARMLGRTENPTRGRMDEWLEETAHRLGAQASFGPVPQGIYFDGPGETRPDPFFGGQGPLRTGCTRCGSCLTGCAVGAKNSLDKNYLHLAEQRGARVVPQRRVEVIRPCAEGYEVEATDPLAPAAGTFRYRAPRVFVAAGVLGTVELLLRCRDRHRTLPALSHALGQRVRTNSEAIVAILSPDPALDLSHGTAISSHFHADAHTHITQNRFPRGYAFMRFYMGPLVDGGRPLARALHTLWRMVRAPRAFLAPLFARNWHRRVSVLTVMQALEQRLTLRLGRSLLTGLRVGLVSEGEAPAAYIPEANRAARAFAEVSGGTPSNVLLESVGNLSVTAHVLGGAAMGKDREHGVIDARHEVFGYPGLFVVDGAALPINVGVNPSLTITALAERCLAAIPHA